MVGAGRDRWPAMNFSRRRLEAREVFFIMPMRELESGRCGLRGSTMAAMTATQWRTAHAAAGLQLALWYMLSSAPRMVVQKVLVEAKAMTACWKGVQHDAMLGRP